MISRNPELEGIRISKEQEGFKIIQHGDDLTIFIRRDQDFEILTEIMNTYCEGTGSKSTENSGSLVRQMEDKIRPPPPRDFKWVSDKINILVIYFVNEITTEEELASQDK